jgi:signal transduction histidine kinase
VSDVLEAYLLALPVVLIVVAAGSWWTARRALQPIATITKAAASITAEHLDARLPPQEVNDEIGQHVLVLNDMFDRLQRGFEQATRFTADASHELRTPLTILRGEIEGALRLERLGTVEENVFVSLLEQVQGLQKISENLLLLARFDAGKTQIARERVDLSALVTDAVEDAELLASPSGLDVSADVAAGVIVEGDPLLLRRLLLNLIDNAVRYNRPKGSVRLSLKQMETAAASKTEAVFTLANTGAGIPEKRRGELFQRFFRLDADRNHATGGTGLGLSLCREIAVAHGGRIELTRGESDATEFTVTLPAARE